MNKLIEIMRNLNSKIMSKSENRKYKFYNLFETPKGLSLKTHIGVFLGILLISFLLENDYLLMGLLFVYLIIVIKIRPSKTKKQIHYIISEIFLNNGVYSKKGGVEVSPMVFFEEDEDNIYIQVVSNYGIDVERVKSLSPLFSQGFGYPILKTETENNNVLFMLSENPLEVDTDHLYMKKEYPILGFDEIGQPIEWDFLENPHLGVWSRTGGGKSVFVKQVITQLKDISERLLFIDFKEVEFGPLEKYGYEVITSLEDGLMDKIRQLRDEMNSQNQIIKSKGVVDWKTAGLSPKFIIFDEFASLSDSFPSTKEGKAEKAEFYSIIGDIARRGRSIGFNLILVTQRPDASIIPGEIRNNITTNVVLRGGDPETRNMAFNDRMPEVEKLPRGYALVNNENDEIITMRIPMYESNEFITDMRK